MSLAASFPWEAMNCRGRMGSVLPGRGLAQGLATPQLWRPQPLLSQREQSATATGTGPPVLPGALEPVGQALLTSPGDAELPPLPKPPRPCLTQGLLSPHLTHTQQAALEYWAQWRPETETAPGKQGLCSPEADGRQQSGT